MTKMKSVLYPGSFDPFTNGHLDLVERAARLFDRVIVAVAFNIEKSPFFSPDERRDIILECCRHLPNVEAVTFDGLLIEAIPRFKAQAILRGLRAFSDFESELQMALMNRSLGECETIFMTPTANNSFVSSRMVKEVAQFGGDFTQYVPAPVVAAIRARLARING